MVKYTSIERGENMKKYAIYLVYLAIGTLVLAVVFRLGGISVGPIMVSTLKKATDTLLLLAIAIALVEK